MDSKLRKTVALGVAGSGKTNRLIDRLDTQERFLIVTYTINNLNNLKERICKKFGGVPGNIHLMSYFSFLHSFCFRPQLALSSKITGINHFSGRIPPIKGVTKKRISYYLDNNRRLYGKRIAQLLVNDDDISELSDGAVVRRGSLLQSIKVRLEKYYDEFLLDEVQDLDGHDFNFITKILDAKISFFMVGDFYQHTFSTSRDGTTNVNLYGNYDAYVNRLRKAGLSVDDMSMTKSHRCANKVCQLVEEKLGINMKSGADHEADVIRITIDSSEAKDVVKNDEIIKLFYQKSHSYECRSDNWGNAKGRQYKRVCVVLNQPAKKLIEEGKKLKPVSRNKLYVALTRSSGNVYLLSEDSEALKATKLNPPN